MCTEPATGIVQNPPTKPKRILYVLIGMGAEASLAPSHIDTTLYTQNQAFTNTPL